MSKQDDETARAVQDVNASMGEALGYDRDTVIAMQEVLHNAARMHILAFAKDCKEDMRIAPCTSVGTLIQVAIHMLIQLAPDGPVLPHLRVICDMIERSMEGKPPLPAHLQRAEKLGIAISVASRRKSEGGGPLQ